VDNTNTGVSSSSFILPPSSFLLSPSYDLVHPTGYFGGGWWNSPVPHPQVCYHGLYDVYICLYEPVLSSGAVIWRERKRKRRRSCGEEVEWGGVGHRCGGPATAIYLCLHGGAQGKPGHRLR
jgi:hypothetical protein